MFRIDLHVHTSLGGDSDILPERLVDLARSVGLDGVGVVEHHSFDTSEPLESVTREKGFLLVRGLEYHGAEGHLLVFGFPGGPGNLPRGLPLQHVIDKVFVQGGIAIPAHPFQQGLVGGCLGRKVFDLSHLIAIETENGSLSREENLLAEEAARRMGLRGTGGSDAHGPGVVGRSYTVFPYPMATPGDLIRALREGTYHAERNPRHPMNR